MEIKRTKKGQMGIGALPVIAIGLVVSALIIGFGAQVLDSIGSGLTGASAQAVGNGTLGLGAIASQLPNVGLVAGAVVIIGLLIAGFGAAFGGGDRR